MVSAQASRGGAGQGRERSICRGSGVVVLLSMHSASIVASIHFIRD